MTDNQTQPGTDDIVAVAWENIGFLDGGEVHAEHAQDEPIVLSENSTTTMPFVASAPNDAFLRRLLFDALHEPVDPPLADGASRRVLPRARVVMDLSADGKATVNITALPAPSGRLVAAAEEVRQVNVEKGWFEDDRPMEADVALLITEISEAMDAYRRWRFEDATAALAVVDDDIVWEDEQPLPKPEGVGSELADVMVRLLDLAVRRQVDLALVYDRRAITSSPGDFITGLNHLTELAIKMAKAQQGLLLTAYAQRFWLMLEEVAEQAGIDLWGEFVRKVEYNRTRPHRHGGKIL